MQKIKGTLICLFIAVSTYHCSSPEKEKDKPQVSPKVIEQDKLIQSYQDSLKVLMSQLSELVIIIDSLKDQPAEILPQLKTDTSKRNVKSDNSNHNEQQLLELQAKIASMEKLIEAQEKDSLQSYQKNLELQSTLTQTNTLLRVAEKRIDSLVDVTRKTPEKITVYDTIVKSSRDTVIIEKASKALKAKVDSLSYLLTMKESTVIINTDASNLVDNNQLSEAFRIYLEAKKVEPSDPTLALKLTTHAMTLSEDSIITAYYNQLVTEQIFYINTLKDLAPVKAASIGSERLITVFASNLANYYDLTNPNQPQFIKNFDQITSAALGNSGQLIMGQQSGAVSFYAVNREEVVKRVNVSNEPISAVNIIGNALYYWAIGTHEKRLVVLDKKYNEVSNMVGMQYPVNEISVSPKTGYIATSCKDLNPRIWSPNGKLLLKIEDQPDSTMTVAISASGKSFISGHANGLVKFWSIEGQLKAKSNKHQSSVLSSAFGSDQVIATGDQNGLILIWNAYGDVMHELRGHTAGVTSLQFTDPTTLYSSSLDGSVKQWHLNDQDVSVQPPLSPAEKKRFKIK